MSFKKHFPIAALVILACSPSARALDLSVLGAVTASNYSISPAPTATSSGLGFGFGATIGFGMGPFFSLETGALFLAHTFSATVTNTAYTNTYNSVEVPVLFRISPISLISFNVGGYYGI